MVELLTVRMAAWLVAVTATPFTVTVKMTVKAAPLSAVVVSSLHVAKSRAGDRLGVLIPLAGDLPRGEEAEASNCATPGVVTVWLAGCRPMMTSTTVREAGALGGVCRRSC